MNKVFSIWLGIAVMLLAGSVERALADPADVIYLGGIIITVNDALPFAEAVAVKDGKILAVGTRASLMKAYKGERTQVVNLRGKTMTPPSA